MGGKRPDQYRIAPEEAGATDYKYRPGDPRQAEMDDRRLSRAREGPFANRQPIPPAVLDPRGRGELTPSAHRSEAGSPVPRLRDIMSEDVVALGPATTLRDAVEILSQRGISGAPVALPEGRVVGVVSTTDLLDFAAALPGVPTERAGQTEWGEIEGPELPTDEEDPGAYYTDLWDDAGAEVLARFDEVDGPEWDVLDEHTVEEVMTRRLCELPPDADLVQAARYMLEKAVHRVLVVDSGTLVGVATSTDFLRAIADGRLGPAQAAEA